MTLAALAVLVGKIGGVAFLVERVCEMITGLIKGGSNVQK